MKCYCIFGLICTKTIFNNGFFLRFSFNFDSIFVGHIFQFQWQLDGQQVTKIYRYAIGQYLDTNGDVITHLNITHVQTEDGGLYKCIASNSMGSVEFAARLNVYGKKKKNC